MAIYQGDVLLSKGGTPTAMLESNTKSAQKFWRGSKAEYDAIEFKDPNTMYIVTDGNASSNEEDNNLKNTLNSHINDFTIHVTPGEKKAWDEKASIAYVDSIITTHNSANDSHNDIRFSLDDLTTRLNALANSSDEELDQLAEIVAYIKSNKELIDAITTNKISVDDIVTDLITNLDNKVLSASQGVALKGLIDEVVVNIGSIEEQLNLHIDDLDVHVTVQDKENWNSKTTEDYVNQQISNIEIPNVDEFIEAHNSDNTSHPYILKELATKENMGAAAEVQNNLTSHTSDTVIHVTADDKTNWNNKTTEDYVNQQIDNHNVASDSHNDIRLLVNSIKEKLDNLVDSGENLDQISEVVKLIEDSDSDILQQLTNKVNTADIANNLTTNSATVPLSAAQGVALKALIDNIGNIVGTVSNNLDIINGEVV